MSDVPKPKSSDQESRLPDKVDESLIVNPINIARARHASAHSKSSTEAVAKPTPKKAKPVKASPPSPPDPTNLYTSFFGNANGCVVLALFGITFFFGSIVGGLVGGGLFWSVVGRDTTVANVPETPTPTQIATATPLPVATITSTPDP